MGKTIRTVLLFINLPIYYLVFKRMYKSTDEFLEALRYYFQPDMLSTAKGELFKDMKSSRKIGMFILVCIAIIAFEDFLLSRVFEYLGVLY